MSISEGNAIDSRPGGRPPKEVYEPRRTCVGCGATDEQHNLVRWVAEPSGRIKLDVRRREPGRGAWLHRQRSCVERAVKGGFSRSLRRKTQPVEAGRLWEMVEDKGSRT